MEKTRKAEIKKISKEDSMKIRALSYEDVLKTDIIDDAWKEILFHHFQ